MRKLLIRLAAAGMTIYLILLVLAWRFQERLAFPGAPASLPTPQDAGFPRGERITLTARDGATVSGWYLPPEDTAWGAPTPGLLWFHGNRENIRGIASVLRRLRPPAAGVVVIDYRGYGESHGTITESGVYDDAEAAWEYLASRSEVDATRIAVYGRSIGTAAALHVATSRPAAAVVLDSPFSSGSDMARRHYPIFPLFLRRMKLDNVAMASRLTAPLMVLHGADDYIAPVEMGRTVARAGHAAEVVIFEEAGHNDTYSRDIERYRQRMHEFLAKVFTGSRQGGTAAGSRAVGTP